MRGRILGRRLIRGFDGEVGGLVVVVCDGRDVWGVGWGWSGIWLRYFNEYWSMGTGLMGRLMTYDCDGLDNDGLVICLFQVILRL